MAPPDETSIEELESVGDGDIESIVVAHRRRFLAGHMEPELARHCVNVGRVTVEFACLEEDIGRLLVEHTPGARRDPEAYMTLVQRSGDIPKLLRHAAKDVGSTTVVDLSALADDYGRFKLDRDRYAHSSVGASSSFDETTRVLAFKTMQQKHPKGGSHPKGRISDLPTDDETEELCRQMRAYRYALQQAALNVTIKAAIANMMRGLDEPFAALTENLRRAAESAIRPATERMLASLNFRSRGRSRSRK